MKFTENDTFFPFVIVIFCLISLATQVKGQNFEKEKYEFQISEESVAGSTVGTVKANSENTITYSIKDGNTNKAFQINPSTGVITTAKLLNYHSQSLYNLVIKADDGSGAAAETTAQISVKRGSEAGISSITWGTAADHPDGTHESQGRTVGGKVYIFGGFDIYKQPNTWTPTKRAFVFDPVANKFSPIADLPYTPNGTNFGGVTHSGITTDGNDIYFAGGYTSNNSGNGQIFGTKQAWKYNVATNSYTALPDLPIPIAAGQLENLNGKLHHISGTNLARTVDLENHYVLDLDNLEAGWKTLAPLPNPRQHAGSAVFEGKIYFIGGQTGHDQHLVAQKDVHVYDPAKNEWKKVADLPVPAGTSGRGHITSTVVVLGENIIVLGGETAHGKKTNLVSAYNPSTNTWKELTPLPQNIMAGVAAVLNNNIYYVGGDFRKTNRKGNLFFLTNPSPSVSITKPANSDSFKAGQELTIEATASISEGSINKVEFFAGSLKLGEDTEAPYTYTWSNIIAGNYALTAKATSSKGVTTTSSKVNITVTSNSPPTVEITSPEAGFTFSEGEPVSIVAEANDTDGNVAKVEFFRGTTKLGEDSEAPYEFSWVGAAPGNYVLTAKATDNEGATTTSSPVNISVKKLDNISPEISILSPESGASYLDGTDIEISAEVTDVDGFVDKVEFYSGDVKLGEISSAPFNFLWQDVSAGNYIIKAVAFDNDGASKESETVSITVNAPIACPKTGGLLREYWLQVPFNDLSSVSFDGAPSGTSEIKDFQVPLDFGDNYLTRVRGFICAPATGEYVFWISSSHSSELWISSNENPENKTKIARSEGNEKDMWDHHDSQQSEPVHLTAGQLYYVEAIHLAKDGEDHFAVGWQWPNGKTQRPIPGDRLIKFDEETITSIEKHKPIDSFKVYPVPTPDKFFIEFNSLNSNRTVIELLNNQGLVLRKLYDATTSEGKLNKIEVDKNLLPPGIYFIRLTNSKSNQIKKVIVM